MLLSYLALAVSVSIDSLGIGITYGLRKTKISTIAKVILFFMSLIITSLSICLGNTVSNFLPNWVTKGIGIILLISMGCWIIYQSISPKKEEHTILHKSHSSYVKKTYNIFLKSLGITIRIIRDPISSDLDCSKQIDAKEAIYLGLALSIDSICVGFGGSILGFTSFLFPILVAVFQLAFLSMGNRVAKKVMTTSNIPENVWNVVSGFLLICIGISRFFI